MVIIFRKKFGRISCIKNFNKKDGSIKNFLFILNDMWKIDKIYIIFYFLATLLEAITPVLSAYFLKIIVNVLTSSTDYSEILDTGILFIEIFIPLMVLKIYINTKILNVRSEKISDKIKWKFTLKTKQIDMSSYENSQYYDIMVKTMNDADYRYHFVVSSFFNYVGSLITITGLFTLVLSIDYYLIISVFVYVLLLLLVFTNTNNSIEYSKQMEIIPKRRFLNFANYIFKTPQFIQEEKIYNTSDIIGNKYDLYSNEKFKIIKNKNSKLFYVLSAKEALNILLDCFIILYLGYKVYYGFISLGEFTAMMSALKQFGTLIATLFMVVPTLKEHNRYICNIKEFLNYSSEIENNNNNNKNLQSINTMSIKNLSFYYPNTDKYVQRNLNFEVNKGERIAIVGHNGSGKTTLIKLLLRLYDPIDGNILINNDNLKDYDTQCYRMLCSVIFQDFRILPFSIKENITYKYKDFDEEKLDEVVSNVSLKDIINSLPKKIDTILSKEYDKDGINVSGGEKQKIAIARALYRSSDLVILDEASSALDPITEVKLNEMFLNIFKDKIVFIISHRLSTTKNCDKILVMKNGEIVEIGNHKELMERKGEYFEMFTQQSLQYIEN